MSILDQTKKRLKKGTGSSLTPYWQNFSKPIWERQCQLSANVKSMPDAFWQMKSNTKLQKRLSFYLEPLHTLLQISLHLLYPYSLWYFKMPNVNNYKMQAYKDQVDNKLTVHICSMNHGHWRKLECECVYMSFKTWKFSLCSDCGYTSLWAVCCQKFQFFKKN